MGKLKIGVLGSGAGSNMQSIVDAIDRGELDAEIKLVLADVPGAKILERARNHALPHAYLDCAPYRTKLEGPAEDRCIEMLKAAGVDTVVLAGFMRIVKPKAPRGVPRPRPQHPSGFAPGVPRRAQLDAGLGLRLQGGGGYGAFRRRRHRFGADHRAEVRAGPGRRHARNLARAHPGGGAQGLPEALRILSSGNYRIEGRRVRIGQVS